MYLCLSCFWMLIFFFCDLFYYFQTHKHLVVKPFFKLCCYWEFSYLHVEFTWRQRRETACSVVSFFISERTVIWRYNREITIACPSVSPKVFILQNCKASILAGELQSNVKTQSNGLKITFLQLLFQISPNKSNISKSSIFYDGIGRGTRFQI